MSLLNPVTATTSDHMPAPVLPLQSEGSRSLASLLIGGAMLFLGIGRIGTETFVQDLHNGGLGLPLLAVAYTTYMAFALLSPSATDSLRTTGLFRFTRNPLHLAFFLPLAALSYFSVATSLATIVLYVTAMNLTVIRAEERDLQKQHGAAYVAWRNAVPRWFA